MKKWTRILLMASAMSFAAVMTSFAATRIGSVTISATADDDEPMNPGECADPYFDSTGHGYEISNYDDLDSDNSPAKTHTYEINIDAYDGYYFSGDVGVNYTGITEVTRKKIEDDGNTLVLRVEAYPYYMFARPENLNINKGDERFTWDEVRYADKYEYVIDWTDDDGDERTKHGTTSKEYVDISSYIGKGRDIDGAAVRATGDADNNPRTADGEWATIGDVDISDYEDDFDGWSDAVGNAGNTSGNSTGGQSNNYQNNNYAGNGQWVQDLMGGWHWNTPNGYAVGWVNDGTAWYYCNQSGTMLTGWINDGTGWYYCDGSGRMLTGWVFDGSNWYYCNTSGLMQVGWIFEGSNWYYLNPTSAGAPYGAMLTGWRSIAGNTYYFNPVSGGMPYGAMLTGYHVIDGVGYQFNQSHDGTYGRLM